MGLLIINILLALVWSALTGRFTLENLTTGFILGYIILYLLRGVFGGTEYFAKGAQLLRFTAFFFWELLVANLRVARDVLRPGPLRLKPRVIAVALDLRGEVPVTLLANIISLTPGSLSLDVSNDQQTLFVHVMHAPNEEAAKQEIKVGFEHMLVGLFSQSKNQPDHRQEEREK